jgi:hypothetical protein
MFYSKGRLARNYCSAFAMSRSIEIPHAYGVRESAEWWQDLVRWSGGFLEPQSAL